MKRFAVIAASTLSLLAVSIAPGSAQGPSSSAPSRTTVTTQPKATSIHLGLGDTGEQVRQVQYVLHSYGFAVTADGVFGIQTQAAVTKWQKFNGLDPVGYVGPKTWASLGLDHLAKATPKAPSAPKVTIPPGWTSPHPEVERWHATALAVGWSNSDWPRLACIIWRESGGRPEIANSAGAVGLTQIMYAAHAAWLGDVGFEGLKNPATNLRVARQLHDAAGWTPWAYPPKPC